MQAQLLEQKRRVVFKTGTIAFPVTKDYGPVVINSEPIDFFNPINNAVAVLVSTSFGYSGSDHHIGNVNIGLNATISEDKQKVTVTATLGVRDWSGNWDDAYVGSITYAVFAEFEVVDPAKI